MCARELLLLQRLLGHLARGERRTAGADHGLGCWGWLVGTVHYLCASFLSHTIGTSHHAAGGCVIEGHAGRCRIRATKRHAAIGGHHGRDVAQAQFGAALTPGLHLLTLCRGCVAASNRFGSGLCSHIAAWASHQAARGALVVGQLCSGLVLGRSSAGSRVQAGSGCHVIAASGCVGDHRHGDAFSSGGPAQCVGPIQRHGCAWL